jgi:hypothetical protein
MPPKNVFMNLKKLEEREAEEKRARERKLPKELVLQIWHELL